MLERGDTLPTAEAILRERIEAGTHWYLALLEAIGRWDREEEVYQGRTFQYLVGQEAFDWLLLAERLLAEVDGFVPQEEKETLLFFGRPPIEVSQEDFKNLIGYGKYRGFLNYFYGISVEEALLLAVEEEVRKERRCQGAKEDLDLDEEVWTRIYGQGRSQLLERFRRESGYPQEDRLSFSQVKEFTYWLFKYRLRQSHKARMASDTKKGLEELRRQRAKAIPLPYLSK